MANLSQCLDDITPMGSRWPAAPPDLYSEAQRLALEELVSGGPEALRGFLQRERVAGFLSEPEVGDILSSASSLQCGEEEVSVSASVDCSSVTYFPEISDVEPPLLELGWPAFSAGSYRGATRVEVHFQPGFGDVIYSCKEAVRALIKGAREVIAVVMDSFTDNDIFRDIHEACRKRCVPAYILVDESQLPHFLTMCQNLGISIETELNMRVRTLTGNNYYTRSGAKIVGKAHEKFLLVDGLKAATGSYSFTWMDGKLNSSNTVVLSGQIVEKFDLQFRILYAQSKPVSTKLLMSIRNRAIPTDKLPYGLPAERKPLLSSLLQLEIAKLSSTPKRAAVETKTALGKDVGTPKIKASEDDWLQNCDIISGLKETESVATQTEPSDGWWNRKGTDAATQTNVFTSTAGTQTAVMARVASTQTVLFSRSATTQTTTQTSQVQEPSTGLSRSTSLSSTTTVSLSSTSSSSSSSSASTTSTGSNTSIRSSSGLNHSNYIMQDSFKKLGKDRQLHYTSIRSKLDHMVSILSRRNRFTSSYFNCEPPAYGLARRDVMHGSLLNLRDGVRFAPHM
ncbi:PREDICTED: protein FAM83D [Nanorana parkeri]|uniref:protein FAM83D n=1 Tax=Nanorana parkeri TaxID=125878 RepID=UPI0008541DCE|nr:PREDICTED: protein FAM83D [Nanorana parkeri]